MHTSRRIVVGLTLFDVVAAGAVFGHYTWPQRHREFSVWSVSVGTHMGGYQPVSGRTVHAVAAGPPTAAFWVETVILGVFVALNLAALLIARRRISRRSTGRAAYEDP